MGKIKELPLIDRPREKAYKYGVNTLSDYELLAIILQSGCKDKSALEISIDLILKFKGLNLIEDVEKYRQKDLFVERKDAVRLKKDEYFIADLIGLQVFGEDGVLIGTLKDVITTGANDVYAVEIAAGNNLGAEAGTEVLLPAIKQCVLEVDVETGKMVVHMMEGLLD